MEEEYSEQSSRSFSSEDEEEYQESQEIEMSSQNASGKKRGRKGLFAQFGKFKGSKYLTKSTPILYPTDLRYGNSMLELYFDDELKECLISCSKSIKKTKDIINEKKYNSIFNPNLKVTSVFMSMLHKDEEADQIYKSFMDNDTNQIFIEERISFFQKKFLEDFPEDDYYSFLAKKYKRENRLKEIQNGLNEVAPVKELKKKISKNRTYNVYTESQINKVQQLIIQYNFSNFSKISLETGVKVASIKKVSRQLIHRMPVRQPRKKIDSTDSFTMNEKTIMLREAVSNQYIKLNLREKRLRYNELFGKDIRYETYKQFFKEQGYTYRTLLYKPLATEQNRNKFQVFKSSFHILENFESDGDLIAVDESGVNDKCFTNLFWAPRGIDMKLTRDVRFNNHSLIMAISMKFGVISYQIKKAAFNSGYFLNFLKKTMQNYQINHPNEQKICIILDNSKIHKMEAVTNYMVQSPFRFAFTAPYSSPMNPIQENKKTFRIINIFFSQLIHFYKKIFCNSILFKLFIIDLKVKFLI
ncbi:hypothetical protein ABPG74_020199 [Tetrahymena malaccensis]